MCDIAAFIISDTVLFNMFFSQVDWISEKSNIIVAVGKSIGVYLRLQFHLFDVSKVEFLEKRGLNQKLGERNKNRKLN